MSTVLESPAEAVVAAEDRPYAISADMFLAMIEAEVFPREVRVYLQEGEIYAKMSKTRNHSLLGAALVDSLVRRLPRGWFLVPEGEFRLDDLNVKLPDFAVVRGEFPLTFLASDQNLDTGVMGLAIEISATSLAQDLGKNLERYACASIPAYWVADVPGRRLLSHTGPRVVEGRGSYEKVEIVVPGGTLALVLDGQEVARFAYEELMP